MDHSHFTNLHSIAESFRTAWQSGETPSIESYLSLDHGLEPTELLSELIRIEIAARRDRDEKPFADEYVARLPQFAEAIREIFDNLETLPISPGDKGETPRGTPSPLEGLGALQTLGDYVNLEPIGRGGMGIVYRARQVSLGRLVALKTIRSGEMDGDEEVVRRFRSEAEAAASLHHPHIVPIYEIGHQQGIWFFSMELIDGGTLHDLLQDGPLEPRRAASILKTVASAVAYAHERGVVHRDLKPGNVLIDEHGDAKVADFGLAKRVEQDGNMTRTGQVIGTPNYMPPEQARGEAVEATADVYALGAILYCALTGRPPFQAAGVLETLRQVQENEPVPPQRLNPAVPSDLETICLKCLEKSPETRYDSAKSLAEDLTRYLDGRPVVARPIGTTERSWRWCRRHPAAAVAMLVGMIAIVTLSALGVSLAYQRQLEDARDDALRMAIINAELADEKTQLAAVEFQQRVDAEQLAKEKSQLAEQEQQQRKRAEQAEGAAANARDLLDRVFAMEKIRAAQEALSLPDVDFVRCHQLLEECPSQFRNWDWKYLAQRCRRLMGVRRIQGQGSLGPPKFVEFLPDGKVFASDGMRQRAWDWKTGVNRKIDLPYPAHDLAGLHCLLSQTSRQGSKIVSKQISWDLTTGLQRGVVEENLQPSSLAVSTDGKRIALKDGKVILIWDGEQGTLLREMTPTFFTSPIKLSPNGQQIVTCGYRNKDSGPVRIWDIDSGELRRSFGDWHHANSADFSTDGKFVAACGDRTIRVWDAKTGASKATFRDRHDSFCVRFGLNGEYLLSGSTEGWVTLWAIAHQVRSISFRATTKPIQALAMSVDGKYILAGAGDGYVIAFDLDAAIQDALVIGGKTDSSTIQNSSNNLTFSPDGKSLAYGRSYGSIQLQAFINSNGVPEIRPIGPRVIEFRDTRTGKIRRFNATVTNLIYSNDGKRIIGVGPGHVGVWNAQTGEELLEIKAGNTPIWCSDVSADGRFIASGDMDGVVKIWDSQSGQLIHEIAEHTRSIRSVHFRSNSQQLLSASSDGTIRIWDASTGKHVRTLGGEASVASARFDPTGKWIISGESTGKIRVWEVSSGNLLHTLDGHQGIVNQVCFSPDGDRILSGGEDGTLRVWDRVSGRHSVVLRTKFGMITSLAISPDGRRIAAEEKYDSIHIWDSGPVLTNAISPPLTNDWWGQENLIGLLMSDELGTPEERLQQFASESLDPLARSLNSIVERHPNLLSANSMSSLTAFLQRRMNGQLPPEAVAIPSSDTGGLHEPLRAETLKLLSACTGCGDSSGAIVLRASHSDWDALDRQLRTEGLRLHSVRPYVQGKETWISAAWVLGDEPVVVELGLTLEEFESLQEKKQAAGFSPIDCGGYVDMSGDEPGERFFGLWIESKNSTDGLVVRVALSESESTRTFSELKSTHYPLVRQTFVDTSAEERTTWVWQKADARKVWAAWEGSLPFLDGKIQAYRDRVVHYIDLTPSVNSGLKGNLGFV